MTLWKIPDGGWDTAQWQGHIEDLRSGGVLVPVEPCEHGKYDKHLVQQSPDWNEWCPGAGIGDDNE